MAESRSWLKVLVELLEEFFNSYRSASKKRTWHQHVVPYENGWAVLMSGTVIPICENDFGYLFSFILV